MAPKKKQLSISVQAMNIKNMFPEGIIENIRDYMLSWICTISPSPLGEKYKIKLIYNIGYAPKVFVIRPKPLKLANGNNKLPHCYDDAKQHLCLYYPRGGSEWNKTMLLTKTIIPWAIEWLFHYEIWLGTGEWTGGGIHSTNYEEPRSREND